MKKTLTIIFFALSYFQSLAQYNFVKDIATTDGSITIQNAVNHNGIMIFSAEKFNELTNTYQSVLGTSDGTPNGTTVFFDDVSYSGQNPTKMFYMNGITYMMSLQNLWRTDGTAAGTFKLHTNINTYEYVILNNIVYFVATDNTNGTELWRTDGTTAGTYILKDINVGYNSYGPKNLVVLNNNVFFIIDINSTKKIWKTDGTNAGTVLLKDVVISPSTNLAIANNFLFFVTNSTYPTKLWKSDGTEANTNEFYSLYNISTLTTHNNNLYFYNGVLGFNTPLELYQTNGNTVTKLMSSPSTNSTTFDEFYTGGINLLFTVKDDRDKSEIWKTDGTPAGTSLLKVINTNLNNQIVGRKAAQFITINGTTFFLGYDRLTGYELWKTNETTAGTAFVKNIDNAATNSIYTNFVAGSDKLYFVSTDPVSKNKEMFVSDGTASGTLPLNTLYPSLNFSMGVPFLKINSTVYFSAIDSQNGRELWKTDGTFAGTTFLKNISTDLTSSNPTNFIEFNNKLYFTADNKINGIEIWATDGTSTNTNMELDVTPQYSTATDGSINTEVNGSIIFNDNLYLMLNQSDLWKIDKNRSMTKLITSTNFASNSLRVVKIKFVELNNNIYFLAGKSLFKFDGTVLTTIKIFDGAVIDGVTLNELVKFKNKLYFVGNINTSGYGKDYELWSSDGTAAGTAIVKDIRVGEFSSAPIFLTPTNNYLFFFADNGIVGYELWRTDGTEAGTVLMKDIQVGSGSGPVCTRIGIDVSEKYKMGVSSDKNSVYFGAIETFFGTSSLWKSNGTTTGTVKVKDTSGDPIYISVLRNTILFGAFGNLWKSDGTASNTSQINGYDYVQKIYTGPDNRFYIQNLDFTNYVRNGI